MTRLIHEYLSSCNDVNNNSNSNRQKCTMYYIIIGARITFIHLILMCSCSNSSSSIITPSTRV